MIQCPNEQCNNNDPVLISTRNHRREQMDCECEKCHTQWTETFKNLPRETIIPKELKVDKG